MAYNIKNQKPNFRSRFKQGYFDAYNPKKYIGKRPIIYRSSWELAFMHYCEQKEEIIEWGSEITGIPYYDMKGGRHTYFIDFTLRMKTGEVILVEVKPSKDIPRSAIDVRTNPTKAQNYAKWKAAKEYCLTQPNTKFMIVTESFFGFASKR